MRGVCRGVRLLAAIGGSALLLGLTSMTSIAAASDGTTAVRLGGGAVAREVEPAGPAAPSSNEPFPGLAGTTNPWTPLTNQPKFRPGSMLLLTDGTVLVHEDNKGDWWKLTPSSTGSYVDGTWSKIATMPSGYTPEYFASAILPDGRMIVEGGEYNGAARGVWTTLGAVYDPLTDSWTSVAPPAGWTTIGDAQSEVLPNGTFMLANCCTNQSALLNASTLTWTPTGSGKADINDEEGWTLLPNGKVITVDSSLAVEDGINNSELYDPAAGSWTSAGLTPAMLPDSAYELGPQVLNPINNTMLTVGATGATAVYRVTNGKWSTGPSLPVIAGQQYDSADGVGALLPNGDILVDASPGDYNSPTHFFVYDGSGFTQIADTPHAPKISSYQARFLILPTGQVLYDDGYEADVYTPSSTAPSSLAPTITSRVPKTLTPGTAYTLSGTQLAGRAQGAAYGDDVQDNTNYPLVRITNDATGTVTYARTSGFTSVSIAPGNLSPSSTSFSVAPGTPAGASTLVVVGDGVASAPVPVTIS
jgi:hypothetical protein